jgi:hypothetical protein
MDGANFWGRAVTATTKNLEIFCQKLGIGTSQAFRLKLRACELDPPVLPEPDVQEIRTAA